MKNPDKYELLLKAARGELRGEEEHQWNTLRGADPGAADALREERAVQRALDRLPNAPVSSNFTALVLQAALREEKAEARESSRQARHAASGWRRWFRMAQARVAGGVAVAALAGVVVLQQYRQTQHEEAQRVELAQTVGAFTKAATVIGSGEGSEVFQNFDAIHRLALPAESELDLELFAALQK